MTHTRVVVDRSQSVMRHLVLGAIMAMIAFALVVPHAQAFNPVSGSSGGSMSSSNHSGGGGNTSGMSREAMGKLRERLQELEGKKNKLFERLGERGHGSSTPGSNSGKGNWKDRLCNPEGTTGSTTPNNKGKRLCDREKDDDHASSTDRDNSGPGNWKDRYCEKPSMTATGTPAGAARDRICERWKHGSSTPDMRPSTTPMVKVLHPNGGKYYKRPNDGAIIIKWRNTTNDKTVDIDLKTGSTTTSIAKDVDGKKVDDVAGAVLGASTAAGSSYSRDSRTSTEGARGEKMGSVHGMKKMPKPKAFVYRWKDAPEGQGYKIVITAKDGSTVYTDESDATFSVEKNPRGKKWMQPNDAAAGSVLGAATSEEEEMNALLDQLEDTLAEMTVALESK